MSKTKGYKQNAEWSLIAYGSLGSALDTLREGIRRSNSATDEHQSMDPFCLPRNLSNWSASAAAPVPVSTGRATTSAALEAGTRENVRPQAIVCPFMLQSAAPMFLRAKLPTSS